MEQEPRSISQEIKEMHDADQEDRKNWRIGGTDWKVVKPRDDARMKRIEELYSQGLLQTADDMYNAAMIYQHGDKPEHYQKAMELSRKAGELGHSDGKWFSALAEDRYLLSIGKAQIWGTQFNRKTANEPWKLTEPFDRDAKTDEERREMGLTDIEEKLKDLNKIDSLETKEDNKVSLNLVEVSGPRPTSIFDVVINGKKVGKCQVRHTPSKSERMPEGFENHIYYEIFPEFRNKGYATETLKLALEEAKKTGLKEVIITVDSPNIASVKVIEKNGGALLDEKPDKDGNLVRKYKIVL